MTYHSRDLLFDLWTDKY